MIRYISIEVQQAGGHAFAHCAEVQQDKSLPLKSEKTILLETRITLDLVLPVYNPVPGWSNTVAENWTFLNEAFPAVDLGCIVVNDGSTKGIDDSDIELLHARIPGLKYLSYSQNHGKGYALRTGVTASGADFCCFTDIDFPFTRQSNAAVIRELISGKADIVVGSRSAEYHAKQPRVRRWISKFLRGLNKSLLGLKIYDTQCGLKGFNAQGKDLFLQTKLDRYLFDLEFIHLASRRDVKILPVDVTLRDNVVFSSMPVRILVSEGLDFLRILFRR